MEIELESISGRFWTVEEDGGLWSVYHSAGKNANNAGFCIGWLWDYGWSYSDQKTAFPGFIPLDEWVDHCSPGNVICFGMLSCNEPIEAACGNMMQVVIRVAEWHFSGRLPGCTRQWREPKQAGGVVEPLPEAIKLARCLAFIRDGVFHNEEIGMRQRAKAGNFLQEIGE